ncbi:tetraacyldisaccharide 4'-kinase [Chitinimonas sp. BJYL2]|uniref:tetraacyldisaccharide 4'-kinase n=1 Tax=Chitinimonas sp. BJYL2 TaxID=2976696 RepID=UPI0022B3DEE7|nr:tetraacyldisaccharide 4'-kinase [Chitinimonas sp. BJYL2]
MRTPAFWQSRFPAALLLPLAALFSVLAALRRFAYRRGWLTSTRVPVPVVVIGNITAGGAGKTPTAQYLARQLRAAGWQPGIISRGHGGQVDGHAAVPADGDPARFGDEPVLLARTTGCPVFVGRDRVATARALLAAHPDTQVLLCDDGMQHYRLHRDIELALIDGARGLMNGWPLPAGPLREPPSRLQCCDAVIINGAAAVPVPAHTHTFAMRLQAEALWRLDDARQQKPLAALAGQTVHALAGIANPERFFATLRAADLNVIGHAFADHHAYAAADVRGLVDAPLLVTEKDAVKLQTLLATGELSANGNIWVLPVTARYTPDLASWLLDRLTQLRHLP